jgi:hypothetical protein
MDIGNFFKFKGPIKSRAKNFAQKINLYVCQE